MKLIKSYMSKGLPCARLNVDGNKVIAEILPDLTRDNFTGEEMFKILNNLDKDAYQLFRTNEKELRYPAA